jgi:tRNA G18 (ribose-2'-O)-methylase SpoU
LGSGQGGQTRRVSNPHQYWGSCAHRPPRTTPTLVTVPTPPGRGGGASGLERVHADRIAIELVDDLDDPRLQDYAHLREPSRRMSLERAQGLFVVEGHRSVVALLDSPYRVRSILVTAAHAARYEHVDVPVFSLPAEQIERLTGVHFHRGALAAADRPPLPSLDELTERAALLLVLEGVNDHENLGALFRNAAAFGVDAVLLDPTAADPLYRRATRVSLGHVLRVPFARAHRWPDALDDLRAAGWTVVALSPGAEEPLSSLVASPPPRLALLVGAEGDGLSAEARAHADRLVRIPMADGVDSVNVATAAAIALAASYPPPA